MAGQVARLVPLILALLTFLATGAAFGQEIDRRSYWKEAERLTKAGQYEKAEFLYKTVLDSCEQGDMPDRVDCRIRILRQLFDLYETAGKLPQARETLDLLAVLQKGHPSYQSPDHVIALAERNARIAQKQGDLARAEELYRFALNNQLQQEGAGIAQTVRLLDALAVVSEKRGKSSEAQAYQSRSRQIEERWAPCKALPANRFEAFTGEMQKRIRAEWHPPNLGGKDYRTLAAFGIKPDGSVTNVRLKESSGISSLDQSALAAIKKAAPFKNVPLLCEDSLPVRFIFDYRHYQSARKN